MIIKAKPLPIFFIKWGALFLMWFVRKRFNKMVLNNVELKPNHSYILMCNHFGFIDAFFTYYVCFKLLNKKQKFRGLYTMSVKGQMDKKWWLRYAGSFSVEPGRRSVKESLDYAAELLETPGNILLFYPQAELESSHIRHIDIKDGLYEIVTHIKGNCQLIWSSVLLEYFESMKPSAYINLLDCGTNKDFDFDRLKQQVNDHHLKSMRSLVRYTREPGNVTY